MNMMDVVGKTIDNKYTIKKYLGSGKFGYVFLAEQTIFGLLFRHVAIKIFNEHHVTAINAHEVFREAIMLTDLLERHDNPDARQHLVQVYDIGLLLELGNRGFIAMEYAPSGSLSGYLHRGHIFSVTRAKNYMKQICKGLAILHSFNPRIIHRDIKPGNILLVRRDWLKIGDLGVAKMMDSIKEWSEAAGTISYSAPEALLNHENTAATDVYSMGLVFYEILTDANPFNRIGVHLDLSIPEQRERYIELQLMAREAHKDLPPPSMQLSELKEHPCLEAIVMKCLEYSPRDRYQSAVEALMALESCESGSNVEIPEEETGEDPAMLTARGKYYMERGNSEAALDCLNKAVELAPEISESYCLMAKVYISDRMFNKALGVIQAGLHHHKCRAFYLSMAEIYRAMGHCSLADSFIKEANDCIE